MRVDHVDLRIHINFLVHRVFLAELSQLFDQFELFDGKLLSNLPDLLLSFSLLSLLKLVLNNVLIKFDTILKPLDDVFLELSGQLVSLEGALLVEDLLTGFDGRLHLLLHGLNAQLLANDR